MKVMLFDARGGIFLTIRRDDQAFDTDHACPTERARASRRPIWMSPQSRRTVPAVGNGVSSSTTRRSGTRSAHSAIGSGAGSVVRRPFIERDFAHQLGKEPVRLVAEHWRSAAIHCSIPNCLLLLPIRPRVVWASGVEIAHF